MHFEWPKKQKVRTQKHLNLHMLLHTHRHTLLYACMYVCVRHIQTCENVTIYKGLCQKRHKHSYRHTYRATYAGSAKYSQTTLN